jgi:hypothetical protein
LIVAKREFSPSRNAIKQTPNKHQTQSQRHVRFVSMADIVQCDGDVRFVSMADIHVISG